MNRNYEEQYLNLSKRIDELERENESNKLVLKSCNELFKNIICYHDLKPKGILKDIQDLEMELLSFIDNVCNKYNLNYWLDYGTLLGAKRHEGFIPWDDDIDLGMMRHDFEKLFPLLNREVHEKKIKNVHINIYHQNNKNIVISFIQVIYRHPTYKNAMATLDIFPYDFRKTSEDIPINEFLEYREKFHMNLLNGVKPEKNIKEYYDKFGLTYNKTKTIFLGVEGWYGADVDELNIPTKIIFPLKSIKFNGKYFKSPNDVDSMLKNYFGNNYRDFPRVIESHNLLNRIEPKEDLTKYYSIAIKELQKVNKKF